ncbi:MAG: trypsin-like peptidase domain-containing protein [Bryobacteraceae bacterium]
MMLRALILTLVLVGGFLYFKSSVRQSAVRWTEPAGVKTAGLSQDEVNNIEIYKKARQGTVHISSTVYRRDIFFEVHKSNDIGSGFLIDDQGHVLTNSHVLEGGGKIEVTLENHDRYEAQVLARDRRNDLGLIKILLRKKVSYLNFGDSDHVQVGQKVLAWKPVRVGRNFDHWNYKLART